MQVRANTISFFPVYVHRLSRLASDSTGSELYSDLPLSAACLHAELIDLGGNQVGHAC